MKVIILWILSHILIDDFPSTALKKLNKLDAVTFQTLLAQTNHLEYVYIVVIDGFNAIILFMV